MSNPIDRFAAQFIEARSSGRQFTAAADPAPATLQEAYAVQDRIFAALYPGQRGTAWKVGGPRADVAPMAAPIPSAGLLASPAHVPAKGFHMIGIESEIAYRLGRDLPPRAAPYTEEEIAAAVTEALVVIELCDTRLANWKEASAFWRLADYQLNAALVIGSGRKDWSAIDFTKQRVELWIDGALAKEASGVHPYGNPIRLLPWLAAHCATRGGLHAGDIITTGTWTGMQFVQPGAEVIARFPGVGEASVKLER